MSDESLSQPLLVDTHIARQHSINHVDMKNWSVVLSQRQPSLRHSITQVLITEIDISSRTGSLYHGLLNLVIMVTGNPSSVGLGVALFYCGLPLGGAIIAGAMSLSWFSGCLAIEIGTIRKQKTYQELCYDLFGLTGYILVLVSALIVDFGVLISNMIFISDNIGVCYMYLPSSESFVFLTNRNYTLLIGLCIVIPFCFFSDMSVLAKTSMLSAFLAIGVMTSIVITGYMQNSFVPSPQETDPFAFIRWNTFTRGVTIIAFAVVCNDAVFPVFASLKNDTIEYWRKVAGAAFIIGAFVNVGFAVGVYLSFYSKITADVLTNFNIEFDANLHQIVSWLRVTFALSVCFSFPLTFFVTRTYLISLIKALKQRNIAEGGWKPTRFEFHAITVVSLAIIALICFLVTDLGVIFQFTGAFGSSMLGFLLPPLMWYKARQLGYLSSHPKNRWPRNTLCLFVFVFGGVVLLSGILEAIADIYDESSG